MHDLLGILVVTEIGVIGRLAVSFGVCIEGRSVSYR